MNLYYVVNKQKYLCMLLNRLDAVYNLTKAKIVSYKKYYAIQIKGIIY